MLSELFSYDPKDIDPEHRELMADILTVRGEYLRASAEVSDLRARSWAGEVGLDDLAELKAVDLVKLRTDYAERVRGLLVNVVDVGGLMELFPAVLAGVLQNFKVPLPVLMEAFGIDLDNFKLASDALKDLMEDL